MVAEDEDEDDGVNQVPVGLGSTDAGDQTALEDSVTDQSDVSGLENKTKSFTNQDVVEVRDVSAATPCRVLDELEDDDEDSPSDDKTNVGAEHKVEPVVPAKRPVAVEGKKELVVTKPVEPKSIGQDEPETESESDSEGDTTAETEDGMSTEPEAKKTDVEEEKPKEVETKSHVNTGEPAAIPKLETDSKSAIESSEPVTDKSVDTSEPPLTKTISTEKHAPPKSSHRPSTSKPVNVPPHKPANRPSTSESIGAPLKPTSTSDSISSTDSVGLHSKKPPPKVPKKPSSKIAEFQQRLAQQQQQDIGLLAKHHAPPPKPKPKRVMSHESDNGDADYDKDKEEQDSAPVVKPKKVGKLNSVFAKNLDGMLGRGLPGMVPGMGMPLPGMALGGGLPPALAAKMAANHGSDDDDDDDKDGDDKEEKKEVKKHEKKVTDARKGRAKGPRGRKLPGKIKEKIVVNDDTLGVSGPKLSVFTVDSLWSIKPKFDEADFDSSVDVSKSSDVTGHDRSVGQGHGTERRVSSKDILAELKSKVGDDNESTKK
ncbi:unnamed protein product [Ambrosiozyma monospora]|uniref:Unnamed protein product n=1 Tax=Ambrosiozyma monospora TaxID=43982 RepID=A0ACB5TPJ6_AMBMO|nr:unnamed protein product [Ambrosiozyma monospora]